MWTKSIATWMPLAAVAGLGAFFGGCKAPEPTGENDAREAFVDSVLATLTLEDKVGEMTQLTLDMLLVGETYASVEPHTLDTAEMRRILVDMRVGSILNCGGHGYPPEVWRGFIREIQRIATEEKPSGIPVLYGIDAIHGATYTADAALSPQQIGLAAAWDTALVRELAGHTALEVRASGIPWNFSPVLDLGRDPRWPRFWETFGEDPRAVADHGEAMVRGYQEGPVPFGATLKHFFGYGSTASGKDRTASWIPERLLLSHHLPPFERAIAAGAMAVMVNSGEVNGIPVHSDPWMLQDVLRVRCGFEGVVVTDWEDVRYLVTRHRVAKDYKEAIKLAVDAGIDLAMVPTDTEFPGLLLELVQEGSISEARIDESVRRILRMKYDLGLFSDPLGWEAAAQLYDPEAARKAARTAAEGSLTLLKNGKAGAAAVLPLAAGKKVWVSGPTADGVQWLNGGWTGTWQGADTAHVSKTARTAWEALAAKFPGAVHAPVAFGADRAAVAAAAASCQRAQPDVAVLFLGEQTYTEKPGDIEDLSLEPAQLDLVRAVAATGTPIVAVFLAGRPRTFDAVEPLLDAVVMAYLPGDAGGEAIAGLLAGEFNPRGRLPFTWPRHPSSHTPYDHKYTDRIHTDFSETAHRPQYPYGYGLGYTSAEVLSLTTDRETYRTEDTVRVTVEVAAAGGAADEVLFLFSSDSVASVAPPVARLEGWRRVRLPAGGREVVQFDVPVWQLGFVGRDLSWSVEPGTVGLRCGSKSVAIELEMP